MKTARNTTLRNAAIVFLVTLGVMLALRAQSDEVGTRAYNPLAGTISSGTAPFAAYYTAGSVLSSTSALQFAAAEVVVNETGSAVMDFRVEGYTNANMIFVDASADRVGIGTGTPSRTLDVVGGIAQSAGAVALTANAASSFTTSAGSLTLTGADSVVVDAVVGINLNSTQLVIGDSAGDDVIINSDTWQFVNDTAVTLTGGVNGLNFDSNTLSIDATNNRVGIRTAAPNTELEIDSTDAGAAAAPTLSLYRNSASPATADVIGAILFEGQSTTPSRTSYAQIAAGITDPADATLQSQIELSWADQGVYQRWADFGSFGAGFGTSGGEVVLTSYATQGTAIIALGLSAQQDFNEDEIVVAMFDNDSDGLWAVAGFGMMGFIDERIVECAAGVATMDVFASQITVDAGGAACAVTIAETTAASLAATYNATGWVTTITVTNTAGGGVTFPDSANVSNVPVLCSTAGLQEAGSLSLIYANRANDLWLGTSCVQN